MNATYISAGSYTYKGFRIERQDIEAVGATPAGFGWYVFDSDGHTCGQSSTKRAAMFTIDVAA